MGNPDRAQDQKQHTFNNPRVMPANGVTYATSPMGGDLTADNLAGAYLTGALDQSKAEGRVETSREVQPVMAFVDCTDFNNEVEK